MCATKRERTEGVQECNEGESCLKKAKAVMKIGCDLRGNMWEIRTRAIERYG